MDFRAALLKNNYAEHERLNVDGSEDEIDLDDFEIEDLEMPENLHLPCLEFSRQ